jgi:hypothetical protein
VFCAPGLTSLKMAFIENLTDEDIEHLAALSSLEVLTLNVSRSRRNSPDAVMTACTQAEQLAILAVRCCPEVFGQPVAQACSLHAGLPCWHS